MSDFTNGGWSIFIAGVTLAGLLACLILLLLTSKRQVMANDNSTGHTWDGDLRELNNPLPRWWIVLFILTIVFAAGYLVFYPGLGSLPGSAGWTSSGQYMQEQAQAKLQMEGIYGRFAQMSGPELAQQPEAMAIGERLFVNNCAACHGSDARGSKGFPDLTDNDWLYGGAPEKIEETITLGRRGNMPPMAQAVGTAEDVRNLANYVLSLSGSPHDKIAAHLGESKFAVCAGCHGAEGKGNQQIGAPNLSDRIWLHGWGEEAVVAMVTKGKMNEMPSQANRLTQEQIHVLVSYVWSLSNGRNAELKSSQ